MQRTEESFPERALLWQHIKDQNQLVDNSSDIKYIQLYTSNSASARDKNSAWDKNSALIAIEMAGCMDL